jgi:streptomycin 6-kinase
MAWTDLFNEGIDDLATTLATIRAARRHQPQRHQPALRVHQRPNH